MGGSFSLEIALNRIHLGGVISISGPLLPHHISQISKKSCSDLIRKTPVLATIGSFDDLIDEDEYRLNFDLLAARRTDSDHSSSSSSSGVECVLIQGKEHSMPKSSLEMTYIMKFLASILVRKSFAKQFGEEVFEVAT